MGEIPGVNAKEYGIYNNNRSKLYDQMPRRR